MKYVISAVLLLVLSAGLWAYSFLWNFEHGPIGSPAVSPNGLYVAQFYHLPETSQKAHGQGVYVRYRFVPGWVTSTDVFASYCKSGERLAWHASNELTIYCDTSDKPIFMTPPRNVRVKHVSVRS